MCPNDAFLSLPFKLAFEKHHKSNIKHLYYIADDRESKAIGYAQEFNIRSNRIRDYQRKNKVKGNLISLVLKLLNLKVVALGNGLLTNISNFSAVKLSNNIDFFNSLLLRMQKVLSANKFIIPDHFFKELKVENPNEVFPELIKVMVDQDMRLEISKNWNTFEDYTKDLKKKYRSRLKSVMKKSENIEIKVLTQNQLVKQAEKLQELFENVHQKSSFGISPFNTSIYTDLIDSDNPKCQVFGYFLSDEMIAFSSELKDDDNLYSYFIGLDYRYNKSHRLYERILNETIKSAISNKKSKLILGRTAAEFKSNVGAKPVHSEIFVYLKSPILRRLLKPILENIQPSNWVQRNPFKEII
jgi:hypothetical protein